VPSPRFTSLRKLALSTVLTAACALIGIGVSSPAHATTGEVLLSQGKPTTASSEYSSSYRAGNVTDGLASTRWSSAVGSATQWIRVDLGSVRSIGHVRVSWDWAYATSYQVQLSNDASTWTTIYSTSSGNGGVDDIFQNASARYVRVYATAKTSVSTGGYLMWELRVYSPGASSYSASAYNNAVLADHPVAFWNLDSSNTDLAGRGHTLARYNSPGATKLPNGDNATVFNGAGQYMQAADANDLSVTNTGKITIEAWMRPDVNNFSDTQSSSEPFVYWMGKGVAGQHEYTFRMYNKNSDRPNRISAYSYNLSGGLGAGSYFQDTVTPGQWIFVTAQINVSAGTVNIWKNGVRRDQDLLSGYNIHPSNGTAPLRIGTRDLMSYFKGGMGKVAVYDTILTSAQINAHYHAMVG